MILPTCVYRLVWAGFRIVNGIVFHSFRQPATSTAATTTPPTAAASVRYTYDDGEYVAIRGGHLLPALVFSVFLTGKSIYNNKSAIGLRLEGLSGKDCPEVPRSESKR